MDIDPFWDKWNAASIGALVISPVPLLVLIILERAALRWSALWLPCWRSMHPLWILVFRSCAALCMSWFLYSRMVLLDGIFAFYYYTQWTFALVIIYFVIGACISAHGCWIYSKYHPPDNEEANGLLEGDLEENCPLILTYRTKQNRSMPKLQRYLEEEKHQNARFWGYVMQAIYQASAGAVVLTDIVFWGLLVPFSSDKHFKVNLITASMHSVNAIFLLLDTFLNSMSFPWFRIGYFILWSCSYVAFQMFLHNWDLSWGPDLFPELNTPWIILW
ncbi:hypothetical protein IHE45_06G006000 [Dioscorea alata]|nr:hypothetical protein IHE45_06G006000 [Dioscorea alata]